VPVGGKIRKLPAQQGLPPHNFHCLPGHSYALNALLMFYQAGCVCSYCRDFVWCVSWRSV